MIDRTDWKLHESCNIPTNKSTLWPSGGRPVCHDADSTVPTLLQLAARSIRFTNSAGGVPASWLGVWPGFGRTVCPGLQYNTSTYIFELSSYLIECLCVEHLFVPVSLLVLGTPSYLSLVASSPGALTSLSLAVPLCCWGGHFKKNLSSREAFTWSTWSLDLQPK